MELEPKVLTALIQQFPIIRNLLIYKNILKMLS